MIQELFGGGAGVLGGGDQRKVSINCGVRILEGSSISNSSHPSTTSTTTNTSSTAAAAATNTNSTTFNTSSSSDNQQNLRCPRCDSANTKFCYYNNYNLTQPRHFCKTCRRYWTKGGALRNVPIGGGCRKNKSSIVSTTTAGKAAASSSGKIRTASPDIVKSSLGFGFDHDPPSNPILWSSSQPQNSQLLALLRATQNPNPNPNPIKEEGNMNIGSHMISDTTGAALNARSGLSLDPTISHAPFSLCSSFWRNNNQHQTPQQHHHQQQQGFLVGEVQNTGIQELYQRLRSSANYYSSDHSPSIVGNVASTSINSSSIFEPAATVAGGDQLGYWNPSFSWPNLSTTNGAFP